MHNSLHSNQEFGRKTNNHKRVSANHNTNTMKVIHKYQLKQGDRCIIAMPPNAKIIHVGVQRNVPTLWAEVELDTSTSVDRMFYIIGTGDPLPVWPLTHLGTVLLNQDSLVHHIYEPLMHP